MVFNQGYMKMFLLLVMVVVIFSALKFVTSKKNRPPDPEILSTNVTLIYENGIPKVKAEAEIKNNGGKGYIVVVIKTVVENEKIEKNIDIYMQSNKKQKVQVLFDDKRIISRNPEFVFLANAFNKN